MPIAAARYYRGMPWPDRIVIDPEILAGKPVVRGHPAGGRVHPRSAGGRAVGGRDPGQLFWRTKLFVLNW